MDPDEFRRYFRQQRRFAAGVATRCAPSIISGDATHQHPATGFPVGVRFHSTPVIRLADTRPMQLGHVAPADGAWRLYVFADDGDQVRTTLEQLPALVQRFTPADADPDSVIDVRAVFIQPRRDQDVGDLPAVRWPRKAQFGLVDQEKVSCPDPATDVFTKRGIAPAGCLALTRPDQHVAAVLPLTDVAGLSALPDDVVQAV